MLRPGYGEGEDHRVLQNGAVDSTIGTLRPGNTCGCDGPTLRPGGGCSAGSSVEDVLMPGGRDTSVRLDREVDEAAHISTMPGNAGAPSIQRPSAVIFHRSAGLTLTLHDIIDRAAKARRK